MISKDDKKVTQALFEIYRRVYKVSEPPADWDELYSNAPLNSMGQKEVSYMNYECSDEVMKKIVTEVLKEYKTPKRLHEAVNFNFWLGCSPKSIKNNE
jgi:hypothetical protein